VAAGMGVTVAWMAWTSRTSNLRDQPTDKR
jgi:hypothetical protein